jgi:monoamine oxidase
MTILDVAIVGGGLSGLFVGFELGRKLKWVLFEASSRVGGRLINAPATTIDMGGAWVWPEYQPNMRDLVYRLSLTMFAQPGDADSTRIVGGAVQFIDRLCGRMQETRACQNDSDGCKNEIRLNSPITSCKLLSAHDFPNENNPLIRLEIADGTHVLARRVVFAVPPQLLSTTVSFDPLLSESKQAAMSASRTWMAGVTKVALVYPKRFWDASSSFAGLPSFSGPAFQVYDAGPRDESVAALTFFSHVPPESLAQSNDSMLANQVADQMANHWRNLGTPKCAELAHTFTRYYVHRWPENPYISGTDSRPDRIHPHPAPSVALSTPEWNGRLLFAGTETDLVSPGVMEGAIGAAKRALKQLSHERKVGTVRDSEKAVTRV